MINVCYTCAAVYFTCIKSLCIPCAVIISCGTLALFTTGVVAVNTNNNGSIARLPWFVASSSLYIHSRAKDSTLWSTSTTTNTRSCGRRRSGWQIHFLSFGHIWILDLLYPCYIHLCILEYGDLLLTSRGYTHL